MRIISLMPVGRVDRALLEPLAEGLTQRLRVACSIQPDGLEAEFAFNPLRRQYHSTEILKKILQRPPSESWKVLGVTEMDLYIPVLTFVFGEAQLRTAGRWSPPIACARSSMACPPIPNSSTNAC